MATTVKEVVMSGDASESFDPEMLRQEAARVLQHPLFTQSERSSKLLRYLVAASVKAPSGSLKERTIGHDVFGREAGYDTYSDPIVRNAASDVRRRLKLVYEAAPPEAPRLELTSGQYRVIVRSPGQPIPFASTADAKEQIDRPAEAAESTHESSPIETPYLLIAPTDHPSRRRVLYALASAVAVPALVAGGYFWGRSSVVEQPHPEDVFWAPVLHMGGRILLSVSSIETPERDAKLNNRDEFSIQESNAAAYARVSSWLALYHRRASLRADTATTMAEMRDGSAVIIGQASHPWLNLLEPELRFRIRSDSANSQEWIEDSQNPAQRWQLQFAARRAQSAVDYATVARLNCQLTGRIVAIVAGGLSGITAAAEFVTRSAYLSKLSRDIADPRRSVQMVLRTQVIDGVSGEPEVIAKSIW